MIDGPIDLTVAHHHPGHLRLRSRALEGLAGSERGAAAANALRAVDGVREVQASAHTGSILVLYDPRLVGPDALVGAAARSTGIAIGSGKARPGDEDRLAYVAIDVVREANTLVQDLTHHRADLRVLVPAALAGLAAWSLVERGARLPSWDNLLYWSYSVFLAVNAPELHRDRAPAGRVSEPP
jgi:copper chaperone CopZ